MKGYKSIAICIIILMMAIMVGCGGTKDDGKDIISSGNIDNISVDLFDGSTKELEGDAINKVMGIINDATLTGEDSVNDTPDASVFGKITVNDGEEVFYYYRENDKYYIEKPYAGIYETDVDVNTFIEEI